MPNSSSFLTKLASVNRPGGLENFCVAVIEILFGFSTDSYDVLGMVDNYEIKLLKPNS